MFRLAYGITRNEANAEEVTQDVLLTICRKLENFDGRSAFGSWLYRVTTNSALNKRRGKRRGVESSLDEILPTYRSDGHRAGERSFVLADWSGTPESELLSTESRAIVNRAIDGLPEHYRAVLVLRDVEGLSSEGVAGIVG